MPRRGNPVLTLLTCLLIGSPVMSSCMLSPAKKKNTKCEVYRVLKKFDNVYVTDIFTLVQAGFPHLGIKKIKDFSRVFLRTFLYFQGL